MINNRAVITIDGLAASGKSTIAALLAQRLGYTHLNTGAIYRAVACLSRDKGAQDATGILGVIKAHSIVLNLDADGKGAVLVDGSDISNRIYTPEVSEATSIISAIPEVRTALYDLQRNAFPGHNLIAEGRDMGTVVFPDADLKFFITASVEIRSERRLKQLEESPVKDQSTDTNSLKKKIEIEITERDRRDTERSIAPTKPADGAVMVDNSGQTLTEIIESMYDSVALRGLPVSR